MVGRNIALHFAGMGFQVAGSYKAGIKLSILLGKGGFVAKFGVCRDRHFSLLLEAVNSSITRARGVDK